MIHDGKTIIACASGAHAHSAIAVIRLSGFAKLTDLQFFFSKPLIDSKPRMMYRSFLVSNEERIDDICYCYFAAPSSYTGENLLELYVHGNTLNVERILNLFQSISSIRLARAGEFSLRALQNKKLTLSQAEGLDLFLNASTPLALQQGMGLLHGDLHHAYLELFESYKLHKASLELLLDFHEDVGEEEAKKKLHESWNELFTKISSLKKRLDPHSSRLLRPEIVIAGLPNAGKSTFFNNLLGEERAIVTSEAGTTRDFIAEDIHMGEVTYRLVDTAGIRQTENKIESRGIELALERLSRAFFTILLINPFESDVASLKRLLHHSFDFVIFTHADLAGFEAAKSVFLSQGLVLSGQVENRHASSNDIKQLSANINKKYIELSRISPILQERQKHVISNTYRMSVGYNSTLETQSDIAILSHELNALGHCLQELLGIVSPDEVLDHIFANFCIGK
jgi:tRNA modification GTPase